MPGFAFTTPAGVNYYRMVVLRSALKVQIVSKGRMRMTRGRAPSTILREMGFRGNKEKQLAALDLWIQENRVIPEQV